MSTPQHISYEELQLRLMVEAARKFFIAEQDFMMYKTTNHKNRMNQCKRNLKELTKKQLAEINSQQTKMF